MFQLISLMSLSVVSQLACGQSVTSTPPKEANPNPPITRTVNGQVLASAAAPTVKLEFNRAFKYVGSQSFVLYDVANAEQHFFVDADGEGWIKRFYWVQFEGYLPNNTHAYDYKSTRTVNAGGFDFFADASPRNIEGNPGRADSDGNRARAFLTSKGYRIDGIRKSIDEVSYTIRFTPRRARSTWSAVNIKRAAELIAQGLMTPPGLKAFEAREENRSGIYSYEQRSPELPDAYRRVLKKNKAAWNFFEAQPPSYRKAANWWVLSAKKEETRLKRLDKLIDDSAQGRTIPQFTRLKTKDRQSGN